MAQTISVRDTVIESERLRLVWLSPEFMRASVEGRTRDASRLIQATLPPEWPTREDARRLYQRLAQMEAEASQAEWLLRALVIRDTAAMAGYVTFHSAPARGRAELGYAVFEPYRRRGYASEAAESMMRWAATRHDVEVFVLSISPENEASLGVARRLGFDRTGSQMDEVDGLEWVFERRWRREHAGTSQLGVGDGGINAGNA
jgi:ribosomal-protein-alanine N-acetyltransferase